MSLADAAARRLAYTAQAGRPSGHAPAASNTAALQAHWTLAALRTLATGQLQDPDPALLRALTEPDRVWPPGALQSAEDWQLCIDSLRACQYLAIANADQAWLAQLRQCWRAAPSVIGPWWPLRAIGEIALATQPTAARVWTDDEIEALVDESLLHCSAPADRAWLALSQGGTAEARVAIAEYEALLARAQLRWHQVLAPEQIVAAARAADVDAVAMAADADESDLRLALAHPASVLRLQARALRALVAATERAGAGLSP